MNDSVSILRSFITWLIIAGTPDRRELIAVGCSEGVWIGLRSDPRCEMLRHLYRQSSRLTGQILSA